MKKKKLGKIKMERKIIKTNTVYEMVQMTLPVKQKQRHRDMRTSVKWIQRGGTDWDWHIYVLLCIIQITNDNLLYNTGLNDLW